VLALARTGELYVWGGNDNGRLGVGTTAHKLPPTLHPLQGITKLATGASFSLVILSTGALMVFGWNHYGNLGLGTQANVLSPEVLFKEGVLDVACGGNHTICLMEDGKVWGWGWNLFGQVGVPGEPGTDQRTPQRVRIPGKGDQGGSGEGEPRVIGVGAGWGFSYLVTEDQDLYIWGARSRGTPRLENTDCPTLLPGLKMKKPRVKIESEWGKVFAWIFLARGNPGSVFSELPVEVVYHFVWVEFKLQ
jgi:alpha-tubulin suppressor-like RCC1 family protein